MATRQRGEAGDAFGGGQEYDLRTVGNALYGKIQDADAERLIRRKVTYDELIFDPSIQVRQEGLDEAHVQMLTEVLMNGGTFHDPIVVFRDEDGQLFVSDGWHRGESYHRALELGAEIEGLDAKIYPGGRVGALEYAETANLHHGLMLSMKSEQAIFVRRLARGHEWARLSDRAIGKELGVDHKTIGKWRSSLNGEISPLAENEGKSPSSENIRVTRDGRLWDYGKQQRKAERKADQRARLKPPVRSFTPDDVDQTPPDEEAYQDVTAGMQPESTEQTAQASGLSREEYALMIATYTRLQKAVLDAQDALALVEQVRGIRAFFALGPVRLQQLHDLLGNLQAQLYPADQHLTVLRERIVHMIVTGEPYE